MPGEDASFQRRQDRVVEPHQPGEELLAGSQAREEVVAELLLDGAVGVAGGAELTEGRGTLAHAARVAAPPIRPDERSSSVDAADGQLDAAQRLRQLHGAAPVAVLVVGVGAPARAAAARWARHRVCAAWRSTAGCCHRDLRRRPARRWRSAARRPRPNSLAPHSAAAVCPSWSAVWMSQPPRHQRFRVVEVAEQRCVVQRRASHEVRRGTVLNQSHRVPIDPQAPGLNPLVSDRGRK